MTLPNIIMSAILAIVIICQLYSYRLGVPTVATFPGRRRAMIALLVKEFETQGSKAPFNIVDMGSGGGQLCRAIGHALPQATVTGLELSPLPALRAAITQRLLGPRNVRLLYQDFWKFDVSHADIIVLFLTQNVMKRMGEKLHSELKPGCLVISSDVRINEGWEPVEIVSDPIWGLQSNIYLYRQS